MERGALILGIPRLIQRDYGTACPHHRNGRHGAKATALLLIRLVPITGKGGVRLAATPKGQRTQQQDQPDARRSSHHSIAAQHGVKCIGRTLVEGLRRGGQL